MGKTPKPNHEENRRIFKIDVQNYFDNLVKQSFKSDLKGFVLTDLCKEIQNKFGHNAYDIAWSYYIAQCRFPVGIGTKPVKDYIS